MQDNDYNSVYHSDYSLCVEAILNDNAATVKSILDRGVLGPRAEGNKNERTLLHVALGEDARQNYEIIKILVKRGFNVNAQDESYRAPLHLGWRNPRIARLLLANGANVNQRDYWGRTPLYLAILETMRFRRAESGLCIMMLIKRRANIEASDRLRGYTLLHYATERGRHDYVRFLLAVGANVNARTRDRNLTPLHIAVYQGYEEIVRSLINRGADIEALDVDQATPLHSATKMKFRRSKKGARNCMEMLLQRGANINACNRFNNSPFLLTIMRGAYHEIIISMLKHQPDRNDKRILALYDQNNLADEDLFMEVLKRMSGQASIREALVKHGFTLFCLNPEDSLWFALKRRNYEDVKLLINTGARPDMIEDNQKFLIRAIRDKQEDVVELLIKNGVSVNSCYFTTHTLNVAIELELPSMVKILLDNGANPDKNWDLSGNGPLHLLVNFKDTVGGKEILEILLKYGLDIDTQNLTGGTPLGGALRNSAHGWPRTLTINGAEIRGRRESEFLCWSSSIMNKLYIAGSYVSDFDIFRLKRYKINLSEYPEDPLREKFCLAEVAEMKRHKLANGAFSLHNIFITEDLGYLSNRALMDKLESVNFEEFPEYGDLLQNKLKRDQRRNEYFSRASEALSFIVLVRGTIRKDSLKRLPVELVFKITSQLNRLDQQNLTFCGQSLKNQLLGSGMM